MRTDLARRGRRCLRPAVRLFLGCHRRLFVLRSQAHIDVVQQGYGLGRARGLGCGRIIFAEPNPPRLNSARASPKCASTKLESITRAA